MYAVIGTSPFADTSVLIGPFRDVRKALDQASELRHKGYVTEVCPLEQADDLDYLTGAEEGA